MPLLFKGNHFTPDNLVGLVGVHSFIPEKPPGRITIYASCADILQRYRPSRLAGINFLWTKQFIGPCSKEFGESQEVGLGRSETP